MTTFHQDPTQGTDRKHDSKDGSANPTVGTETDQKGGDSAAKRQAERDWQDSSKESGE